MGKNKKRGWNALVEDPIHSLSYLFRFRQRKFKTNKKINDHNNANDQFFMMMKSNRDNLNVLILYL